jgi:hypothetical protein
MWTVKNNGKQGTTVFVREICLPGIPSVSLWTFLFDVPLLSLLFRARRCADLGCVV